MTRVMATAKWSYWFCLACVSFSGTLWAADMPTTTAPQKKDFTLVMHYHYQERAYTPEVVLTRVSEDPVTPPGFAEQELISQISAIDALDFDWWLKTWDGPSQDKIRSRMAADKMAEKDWKSLWSAKSGKMRVILTRWLLTGQYVILVYKMLPEQGIPSQPNGAAKNAKSAPQELNVTETATVFHLWNGRWYATLDLEDDPVVLHFADSKSVFERVVRP